MLAFVAQRCRRPGVSQDGRSARNGITGSGERENQRITPRKADCRSRCATRTRRGIPCQSPAMPNGRCRMHGGLSPGAPKGMPSNMDANRGDCQTHRDRSSVRREGIDASRTPQPPQGLPKGVLSWQSPSFSVLLCVGAESQTFACPGFSARSAQIKPGPINLRGIIRRLWLADSL